jgi:hypothetical protein
MTARSPSPLGGRFPDSAALPCAIGAPSAVASAAGGNKPLSGLPCAAVPSAAHINHAVDGPCGVLALRHSPAVAAALDPPLSGGVPTLLRVELFNGRAHHPSAEPHGPEQSAGRGHSHAPALNASGMVSDRRRLRGAVDLGLISPVVSILQLPPALRRGAFLAALLTAPAHAQTACGFGYPSGPQTSASIAPSDDPDVWAVVTIRNRLAGTARNECTLVHDGETVRVTYAPGPRDLPDRFDIIAPPGYVADPPSLILDDETDAAVPIRPRALDPMG